MTRKHIGALADLLQKADWPQLTTVGQMEAKLRIVHEQLRSAASDTGNVAALAENLRREIDAMLSEPDGRFAATLTEFPARDAGRSDLAMSRLRERFTSVHGGALELLEAQRNALSAKDRLQSIRRRFEFAMPAACEALGLADLEERLRSASSKWSVAQLSKTIDACSVLLEEQFEILQSESARFDAILAGMHATPLEVPEADLERRVASLRASIRTAATLAIARDTVVCADAADAHIARMSIGAASDIFDLSVQSRSAKSSKRKLVDSAPVQVPPSQWSALHGFRIRDFARQTSLPFSFAPRGGGGAPHSGQI